MGGGPATPGRPDMSHFGISRTAFYRWKGRFDELGQAGLADRPRRPHRSPRETSRDVVSKILYLRQQYHFGAGRIADYRQIRNTSHTANGGSGMKSLSLATAYRWM